MVEIIRGRYGYEAEDGTIRIATSGKRLSLDRKEEERLVRQGVATMVEAPTEKPKPKRRKGRKS